MASFGRLISTVDPPNPIQHMAAAAGGAAGKADTNPLLTSLAFVWAPRTVREREHQASSHLDN